MSLKRKRTPRTSDSYIYVILVIFIMNLMFHLIYIVVKIKAIFLMWHEKNGSKKKASKFGKYLFKKNQIVK